MRENFALTGKTDAYLEGKEQVIQLASQSAQLEQPFAHPSSRLLSGWSQTNDDQLQGLRQWMARNYPDATQIFAKLPSNTIINIKGECDHEEDALKALGMHFRSTTCSDFKNLSLQGTRVVILNCSGIADKFDSDGGIEVCHGRLSASRQRKNIALSWAFRLFLRRCGAKNGHITTASSPNEFFDDESRSKI
jgi:hypothetical protein